MKRTYLLVLVFSLICPAASAVETCLEALGGYSFGANNGETDIRRQESVELIDVGGYDKLRGGLWGLRYCYRGKYFGGELAYEGFKGWTDIVIGSHHGERSSWSHHVEVALLAYPFGCNTFLGIGIGRGLFVVDKQATLLPDRTGKIVAGREEGLEDRPYVFSLQSGYRHFFAQNYGVRFAAKLTGAMTIDTAIRRASVDMGFVYRFGS